MKPVDEKRKVLQALSEIAKKRPTSPPVYSEALYETRHASIDSALAGHPVFLIDPASSQEVTIVRKDQLGELLLSLLKDISSNFTQDAPASSVEAELSYIENSSMTEGDKIDAIWELSERRQLSNPSMWRMGADVDFLGR